MPDLESPIAEARVQESAGDEEEEGVVAVEAERLAVRADPGRLQGPPRGRAAPAGGRALGLAAAR